MVRSSRPTSTEMYVCNKDAWVWYLGLLTVAMGTVLAVIQLEGLLDLPVWAIDAPEWGGLLSLGVSFYILSGLVRCRYKLEGTRLSLERIGVFESRQLEFSLHQIIQVYRFEPRLFGFIFGDPEYDFARKFARFEAYHNFTMFDTAKIRVEHWVMDVIYNDKRIFVAVSPDKSFEQVLIKFGIKPVDYRL